MYEQLTVSIGHGTVCAQADGWQREDVSVSLFYLSKCFYLCRF